MDSLDELGDEKTASEYGIKRKPLITRLRSLCFTSSFPTDAMHCVLLNVTHMLFAIWNGDKFSDPRNVFWKEKHDIDAISSSLKEARGSVPAQLGHAPRPIGPHHNGYKAAEWKMWLLSYGPALLEGRLKDEYRSNFLLLDRIYAITYSHSMDRSQTVQLRAMCRDFVQEFQELYFTIRGEDNMPACTINVHAILHLAEEDVENSVQHATFGSSQWKGTAA